MKTFLVALFILIIVFIVAMNRIAKNSDPEIYTWKKLPGNNQATTIPPFGIIVQKSLDHNMNVMKHERCHWQQYQEKGLGKYYFDNLKELFTNGYANNTMEMQCYIAENN